MKEYKPKIMYVEDDESLGFVTMDNLSLKGYDIDHYPDGKAALEGFKSNNYDLFILDVMLPHLDGYSLAEEIRKKDKDTPILFLTAKSINEDKIHGLRIGGDDYITKPFSIEELELKIEVFLRRNRITGIDNQEKHFQIGEYDFDHETLVLKHEKEERKLTSKEGDLLAFMVRRKGMTLKREDMLNAVWGDDDYFIGRSMDVFISRLRKYLRHDENVRIENVHGIGFKFLVIGS